MKRTTLFSLLLVALLCANAQPQGVVHVQHYRILSSPSGIAFAQSAQAYGGGGASAAFGSNNAAGSTLVVWVELEDAAATVSSVSDTRGNTYAAATALACRTSPNFCGRMYYAQNAAAGANTVSVAGSTGGAVFVAAAEYTGGSTTATFEGASCAAAQNSGTFTTTVSGAVIVGGSVTSSAPTMFGGFTQREGHVNNNYARLFDLKAGAPGSYSAEVTGGLGVVVCGAAFK